MTNKTASIVSYMTIIGWIIAYVTYSNQVEKSSLLKFHLKQSLGLFLVYMAYYVLISFIPGLWRIGSLLGLVVFVFWIIGVVNAANEAEKPLPLVGEIFEKNLTFIS
ncbi:MAG: DUF4870 domain-containing protein [Saprospiraceae bacterium]|jgi:uncharacterized membrane protein|uniref:DUF4870 domain-containing protein n=1 Tax=Candidatus Brachybacter algidus TaxID=2982024 RepID=UPI001B5DD1CA|nr:hypothetical protein [Candidatus Brachybacter algidus]MBP7304607.1 hypothetical protein [Saprospiraceae bacterium]MBK6372725.1 DUF4870 domain-containing protein [Candidatus Brachybacter algidus]MBK7605528.1 DUF4870 domain-containing protein [Candidatus Brachybacter algidus]MBK8354207.1 DUF4870 domain-containing protein [Candidatus Brachybacter algidus]MBK8602622.1 DUF4870 domain-containing protein [Candidatus Brachybacter algidus]